MKRFWSFLPVLLLISHGCDCGGEADVSFSCPSVQECFVPHYETNNEKNIITGERLENYKKQACRFGKTSCNEETQEIACEDIVYPTKEICDGIDNDCDGQIDEELKVQGYNLQNPCRETETGVCRLSDAVCQVGNWVCIPPDNYGEEVCDGLDNDCDGEVDEDIEQRFVYTGEPDTLNIGECRAGVTYCDNGEEKLHGLVTPILEICGNGDDDDCDGFTDEQENGPTEIDFALLIDFSGSMHSYINSVAYALCQWSADQTFEHSRFAIIGIATNEPDRGIKVITNFTDAGTACNALSNYMLYGGITIAEEYHIDAILGTATPNDWLPVTWSHRTKKMIIFSDEPIQYSTYYNFWDMADVYSTIAASCAEQDYSINAFIQFSWPTDPEWQTLTSLCGGYLEYLSRDHFMMIEKLNYWFGEEC